MYRQGAIGRRSTPESTSSTTVSEDIGSIRFCGFATFIGNVTDNITVVVTIDTQPVTASKS